MILLDHPNAPKFWRRETSGELARIVTRYLDGYTLKEAEIYLMRAYLRSRQKKPGLGAERRSQSLAPARRRDCRYSRCADSDRNESPYCKKTLFMR